MEPFYQSAGIKLPCRWTALRHAADRRRTLAAQKARVAAGWLIISDVFLNERAHFDRALRVARAHPAPRLPG